MGFEEVADRWEEGIGRTEDLRTSHTLDALGGRRICFEAFVGCGVCQQGVTAGLPALLS